VLELHGAAGGNEVFRSLVLAGIVEPTSKQVKDSKADGARSWYNRQL
jgi:uncharacterized membrane protein